VSTFSYVVTARSGAQPEQLFALLSDAPGWPRWAKPAITSGSWVTEGDPPPGGVGAVRKLGRWPKFGIEEVVASEPPRHHAYRIVRGQPVRAYRADVLLTPDDGGTLVTWSATFEPKYPGTGSLLVGFYKWLIGGFARRLAAYAEQS